MNIAFTRMNKGYIYSFRWGVNDLIPSFAD